VQRTSEAAGGAIGIAGAGRVAQAIAKILHQKGESVVAIASRTLKQARAAAAFISDDVGAVAYEQLDAPRILIAVPDDAIQDVAARIGGAPAVALHTSGARGVDALESLRRRGAACGSVHPLQTIATAEDGVQALYGAAFAVSGDATAICWAKQIVTYVHGRVLEIAEGSRPLYHAAAVMASNYLVTMLDAAETLMVAAGAAPADALDALAPLVRASIDNALQCGPAAALTGPVERGDSNTVAAHLEALKNVPEHIRLLYSAAGLATMDLAQRRGLSPERAAAISAVLRYK
jgi:predicted short-subunit dehydrogenase-like oxidoreductase (DUF2520 family)